MKKQPDSKQTDRRQNASQAFDARDRLILALCAELKAERETRGALEYAIRHGALSKEVLSAIASDPVPVITEEDIIQVEHLIDRRSNNARLDNGAKDR